MVSDDRCATRSWYLACSREMVKTMRLMRILGLR